LTQFFIAIKEKGKEVKPLAGAYNQAQLGKAVEAAQKQYPNAEISTYKVPERR
jgi:hypothetical protein